MPFAPAKESPEVLIVALARMGHQDAFSELVRRRQTWLRNLLRRCCNDATLADDLAQQAFLKAWKDLSKLRDPARFQSWLRRLAINVWLAHIRKKDVLAQATDQDELGEETTTDQNLRLDLNNALQQLAPAQRICIVLAYAEGISHQEISDATAIPLGTVKSHIKRGSAHLKTLLGDYDSIQTDKEH